MSMDNESDVQVDQTLAPAARTVTATGATCDNGRDGYPRKAVIDAGLWTDGTHTFTFEDSPDDSVWTALAAAKLHSQNALLSGASVIIDGAADDNQVIEVALLSEERYTRVVQTVAGGPATGLVSGVYIETGPPLRAAGGAGQPMSSSGYQRTQPSI